MSGPINGYEPRAAPAPPPRGLLIKGAGLLTAVPLCTWLLWDTLPAAALLAPLFLISIFAGTARAMKKNIHETFLPVLPSVWLTLAAGLAFIAVSLFSQAVFIWLPQILAGTAAMPHAWLIPLGHLNLLAILSSLLLLTLAAAYACLLCIGKKTIRPAAGKLNSLPLPFPAEQRTPAYKGMKIPQLSRISRNTSSGRIPAARIS